MRQSLCLQHENRRRGHPFSAAPRAEALRIPSLEVSGRRITPGILRPFVPLIKKMYGRAGAADGQTDSSSIMASGPYQLYLKWFYPLERTLCRIWPGLLAFQFVILAAPKTAISHQLHAFEPSLYVPSEEALEKEAV
jgi:hypothetical protein